jgi:hypothetical protein
MSTVRTGRWRSGQPWRNERAGLTDDRLGVILCGRFIAYLA